MDFSEAYKLSGSCQPTYSPDGRHLATTVEYRLILREADSLRIAQLYSCLDRIDVLAWAPNSLYVLCGLLSRGVVQVWSVDEADWSCKIDEGPAGIADAQWTPDGLGVLLTAQFGIRLTLWSLTDRTCMYLRGPKHTGGRGLNFSPDGHTLAVLERHDFKDHLTLYRQAQPGGKWQQSVSVMLDTSDAADLSWSPNGKYIAVWDSCLDYRVVIVNAQAQQVAQYSAYQGALGIKSCSWNPSGEILAVGSYDQQARLLEHVTWQPLLQCRHDTQLTEPTQAVVYSEVVEGSTAAPRSPLANSLTPLHGRSKPIAQQGRSQYIVNELPTTIPTLRSSLEESDPVMGVGKVRWSPDSLYVATHNDSMPGSVWVWDMAAMELSSVLVQTERVQEMRWAPQACTLALVAGTNKVYLWTPAGASIVHIPLKTFCAHNLVWNPRGDGFCLTDKDTFCCAYVATGDR